MTRQPVCLPAALKYADAGWRVVPLHPGGKSPWLPDWTNRASTDPAVITAWWRQEPNSGVGILTGAPGPDVLDVDNRPGGNGWEGFDRLKAAGLLAGAFALIRTRSGGLHVYFTGTSQRNTVRIGGYDLDYRATGGQVAAPPTQVAADHKGPAGAYSVVESRPMTGALFDLAAARKLLAPQRAMRPAPKASPGDGKLSEAARAGICRVVTDASQAGGWSGALFWAGCRYGETGMPLADALTELADAAQPWNEHEAARAELHVRNGWHRGREAAS